MELGDLIPRDRRRVRSHQASGQRCLGYHERVGRHADTGGATNIDSTNLKSRG